MPLLHCERLMPFTRSRGVAGVGLFWKNCSAGSQKVWASPGLLRVLAANAQRLATQLQSARPLVLLTPVHPSPGMILWTIPSARLAWDAFSC